MTPEKAERAGELLRIITQATSTLTSLRTAKNAQLSVGDADVHSGDGPTTDRVVLNRAIAKSALEHIREAAEAELAKLGVTVAPRKRRETPT